MRGEGSQRPSFTLSNFVAEFGEEKAASEEFINWRIQLIRLAGRRACRPRWMDMCLRNSREDLCRANAPKEEVPFPLLHSAILQINLRVFMPCCETQICGKRVEMFQVLANRLYLHCYCLKGTVSAGIGSHKTGSNCTAACKLCWLTSRQCLFCRASERISGY